MQPRILASTLILAILPALLPALVPTLAYAQDEIHGLDGNTSTHVPGVTLLAIPDAPFFAKSTTEWTRTMEDGSVVVRRIVATLARDGQGRTFREHHSFVPAGSTQRAPLNAIDIYDPVARAHASCSVHTFRCILTDFAPRTFAPDRPSGTNPDGSRFLNREDLGPDRIEGIYVTGTRETTTISPGAVGNSSPLVSTREFWYSPQLRTNLTVIRQDPRTGKQAIRLSDLAVGDPNPERFRIPPGYTVEDRRLGPHGHFLGTNGLSSQHTR